MVRNHYTLCLVFLTFFVDSLPQLGHGVRRFVFGHFGYWNHRRSDTALIERIGDSAGLRSGLAFLYVTLDSSSASASGHVPSSTMRRLVSRKHLARSLLMMQPALGGSELRDQPCGPGSILAPVLPMTPGRTVGYVVIPSVPPSPARAARARTF